MVPSRISGGSIRAALYTESARGGHRIQAASKVSRDVRLGHDAGDSLRATSRAMTIISHTRRFVFVHLHKCGGTSIERAYARHAKWGDLILGSTTRGEILQRFYSRYNGLYKHSTARSIRDTIGGSRWSAYRTVAVVRHPQMIMESFYKWADLMIKKEMRRKRISFDEVRRRFEQGSGRASFYRWGHVTRYLTSADFPEYVEGFLNDCIRIKTVDDIVDENGDFLVDDILKLESMPEIVELFRELTGAPDFAIGHANKGNDVGPLVWDPDHLERFRKFNEAAYSRFGYDP